MIVLQQRRTTRATCEIGVIHTIHRGLCTTPVDKFLEPFFATGSDAASAAISSVQEGPERDLDEVVDLGEHVPQGVLGCRLDRYPSSKVDLAVAVDGEVDTPGSMVPEQELAMNLFLILRRWRQHVRLESDGQITGLGPDGGEVPSLLRHADRPTALDQFGGDDVRLLVVNP